MSAVEIIRKKRDGRVNSPREIRELVSGAVAGEIPDYQLSAWLMAVFLRGMNQAETMALTEAFVRSGSTVGFQGYTRPRIDKHSTGGVGDKTSLIVAPLAAAAGLAVPMISGRGLGHTGGTLDKIESVPGFKTSLGLKEFEELVRRHGLALIGPTSDLAPADGIFYGLRDVTATIESVPLIVASILSKKVAEGTQGLVLDVKTGTGAFMRKLKDAENLAAALVEAGRRMGQRVAAVISDMTQPLGRAVGNALEVREAVDTLHNRGPADLASLCLELAARMIELGGLAGDLGEARALSRRQLESGQALRKFRELIEAQGGDPRVVDGPDILLTSRAVHFYRAPRTGYVRKLKADAVGKCAMKLGAGRAKVGDRINPAVGLVLHHKIGDRVEEQEPLATLNYEGREELEEALELLASAFAIGDQPVQPPPLIRKVIA